MTAITHRFHDALAYDQFMARWSCPLGEAFLQWLSLPANMRWLDIGCGTGIFTRLILKACYPAKVVGIDCAAEQIERASQSGNNKFIEFRLADAQQLPFANSDFDIVASALAINFLPNRSRALAEMYRVARPGGYVVGCIWDFAAELSPSWPVRLAMSKMSIEAPPVTGAEHSSLDALTSMFEEAGFTDIAATSIEVTASFADFDEFWLAQTPSYAPITKAIAQMPRTARDRLRAILRAELPTLADGTIEYRSQANAIRGRVRLP